MNMATLNALFARWPMSATSLTSSTERTSFVYNTPFSYTATRSRPTSIGMIAKRVRTSATFGLIFSPAFATILSDLIDTLPPSTPVLMPICPSSPIIGPGAKEVGPAGTMMSLGAVCPAFAGAGLLFFSSIL